MLRVLAAVVVVGLAFALVGAVFEVLRWAVVVGACAFGGAIVWSVLSGRRSGAGPRR